MQINAISPAYLSNTSLRSVKHKKNIYGTHVSQNINNSVLSFKGGYPNQIGHIISEEPLFGISGGGVGTVSHDYNLLCDGYDKVIKYLPIYNQQVIYKKDYKAKTGELKGTIAQDVKMRYIPKNLPEGHPFKKMEGTPFLTMEAIDNSTDIINFLKNNKDKIFLFDEVESSTMTWGKEQNVPIKMFKARKTGPLKAQMDRKHISAENQKKLEFIFTFVDPTGSMKKPYADGSYSTTSGNKLEKMLSQGWEGSPYARLSKAQIELMPALKEKYKLAPKYVLCSDGQPLYAIHFAAQKAANGDPFWQDILFGAVGHNLNEGYTQPMTARQAVVNLGATPEEINKIINSKKFIEALQLGREEQFLRDTVLKNFYNDSIGELNSYLIPIHYAKVGYVPMITTVSEGYHDEIIENELISPMQKALKELDKAGKFKGLTNPLMDPVVSGFTDEGLLSGYKKDSKLKLADGTEAIVTKFKIFDKDKKYDLSHIREIKRQNKINLFERFSSKYKDARLYDEGGKSWLSPGTGQMNIITGRPNKNVKVYGEISDDYITKLKNNKDVKLIVSWGRGDFQKGMDTVIDTFEKYASKDPDAVLILGGPMENEEALATVEKFKMKALKPELKGRMLFMDGWAPGKEFSLAGDVALLPSRFAPCELTDLEAKKYCCTPVVPNAQGMAQKNFDPSISKDAPRMDGYKGLHSFYMTEETALNSANPYERALFTSEKKKIVNNLTKKYKGEVNETIPNELLKKQLEANSTYNRLLRNLRDSVISDELASCLERALIQDRNTDIAKKILKNQVDADTTWFGNGWLSATGKSSGQLYHEYHFNNTNGGLISNKTLIKLDYSDLGEDITKKGKRTKSGTIGQRIGKIVNSSAGKWSKGIIGSTAVLACLGYVGYKIGWLNPHFVDEHKPGQLSKIV